MWCRRLACAGAGRRDPAYASPSASPAKRLQESKQTIPHFYLQTSVNAAAMIARRKAAEPVKLAWDAFFVLAVAKAIAKFDRFRCRLDGERLVPIESDAIGVAIDQDNELYVIPVAAPAAKTVEQISAEIRQGVERLRSGDPEARRIRPALHDGDQPRRLQRREFHPHHQSAGSGRCWASAGSGPLPSRETTGGSASSIAARSP